MVRPLLLNRMKTVDTSVSNNNIPVYAGTTGMNLTDSGVSINSIKNIVNIHTDTVDHISNNNIHVTKDQKERWDSIYATTEAHVINSTAHITQADRNYCVTVTTAKNFSAQIDSLLLLIVDADIDIYPTIDVVPLE